MLPGELQATVKEVEQIAGCEIAVVPDPAANEFDNLAIGVVDGVGTATIAFRGQSISRCALLHEVLHVKRYWLDAVPMLRPTTRLRYEVEAQMINEFIEHLIIIPEERRFVEAESNAHWSAVMAKLVELDQVDIGALRRSLVLQRAMMDIALPNLDHARLYGRLKNENLLEASTIFVDRLRTLLNDTERALVFVSREFGYDLAGFCVGRFNLGISPRSFSRSPSLTHYL